MKNKLLVLSLVLSLLLIACGSEVKEVKQETTSESSTVEEDVEKETEEDVEKTSEEEAENDSATDEDEILWEKDVDLTENTNYSIKWTKNEYDSISISHVVKSKDINELAFCCALAMHTTSEYAKNNENIEYSVQGFSLDLENLNPYFQFSSVLGVLAMEEDGTPTKEAPQWLMNADVESIDSDTANEMMEGLTSLMDKESAVAEIYTK